MSEFKKDVVSVSKEGKRTVITMNDRLCGDIWHLIKDWPDIISNDENLQLLADLNFAKAEQIEEITQALYQMFEAISESHAETVVHITDADND